MKYYKNKKTKVAVVDGTEKSFRQKAARELRRNWQLYVMVAVPLVFLFIFKYVPMYGVQIAFRDYKFGDGFLGSKWVGLKHFKKFHLLNADISLERWRLLLLKLLELQLT